MQNRTKNRKKDLIISVSDEQMGHIGTVANRLRSAGLDIKEVLEATGTITGSAPAGKITAISSVPGVAAVERAQSVQLPPPDSDVQ